jgi:two-component system sensor histidine kinase/response regulator
VSRPSDPAADRVLVLTPFGRDADMVRERLVGAGIPCEVCGDLDALLAGVASSVGAVLVAQEALVDGGAETLLAALDAQEPWSDLPVLLLTEAAWKSRPRAHGIAGMFERANVTVLERPVRMQLLMSSLRSAIRARRRQYQTRDLLCELQRAVQLGDMFVSILGHDLRTPLGAIKLSAELIVRLPDSRALRPAGRILSSTDRMTRMIEQLLDLARIRQGHGIPIDPRAANLGDVCRAVVQELEDAHPQAYVLVREQGSLVGEWDPDRLAQVVSNLVANAIQHGVGAAPVEVDLDGTMPGAVRVRIHNQGSVPAAMLPSLFEAFKGAEALAPAARASRTGLGLGLFIAREIARAHDGDITVRSSEQEGTIFEVVLPRRTPGRDRPLGNGST